MARMFFSVDKTLLSLARRARRRGLSILSRALRPGVAGVFLVTTLFGPASGWGQSRAAQMLAGVQHDEFSTAAEDGGHFSPERLRARLLSLDMMVAAHNARFARLQGRPFAGGAGDEVAPRVFQAALEKFQTAAQMNADVEMRRARFSQKFAAAGGFQYRTFADGKRMWFKNGRVSRIENEKIVDAFGNTHRQDTTDMVYDKRGNLLSSKTETRDANGHITVKRWQGTYSNVPGRDRLASFTESAWDPLGNESRLERSGLVWDAEGKNLLSYSEKATDPYGAVSTRRVWDSTHDKDGNLLSFKEESETKGVKSFREWFGASYKSAGKKKGKDEWQLTSYQEKTTDAQGRETAREWGETKYDDKGALREYTEKTTGPDGETATKTWGDAEFDRHGNLTFFRETIKSASGRETTRVFRNGRYDDHGRVLSYEELTSEKDGPSALRVWSGGRYNERNELLSNMEKVTDSHGVTTTRAWNATRYANGQPSATVETVTDDQGHATTREWNGRFGEHGRLAGFDEKTTDARGNVSTVTQNNLTYDALGRLIGYDERSSDIFGRPTVSTWKATAFDLKDRAIATVRTDQGEDGRERRAERSNIAYDAAGRMTSYEESLEVRGGGLPDASGRQTWTALGYDRHGDLLGFELTTTNARGEVETQRRTTTYDNRGRAVGTSDATTNALGETQTVAWKALGFDAWGNVDKYSETTVTAGIEKTRVWEGRLDARGLATDSRETIADASGLKVTHQLSGVRYDARGRMTDGVRATERSDYPEVSIVATTAGKTYDEAGQAIGGIETTRIQGRSGGETIDLTSVETSFGGAFDSGRATQTRSTVETTGTWGARPVHSRDTVESLFGSLGERTDNRTSQAYDATGALIKENRSTTTRTGVEVDWAGRPLAYEESSVDAAAPKARTTTRRVNHYYGNGELSGYAEETTNAFGVTTRVNATELATDALGQTVQSREKSTQPGLSVKTDDTFKAHMRYDLLGRNIGGHESSSTTGPGLSTRSSSTWRTVFDGAGRVVESTSAGERDGVSFENTTRNSVFDINGRAVDYRTSSQGAAGVSDVETTGVQFDEFGRAYKRHEDGWNNGSYSNADVTAGYDAQGREVKTTREGYNGQGSFREETTTQGFNALGQATGRSTSGWNATEGNYSYQDTGLNYGLTGELLSFDRAKLNGEKKDVFHWATKGVDAAGRSLGFTEVGKSFENGKYINDFTIDHAARAHNGNGQEVSYRQTTTKTYVGGAVETTVSDWKGAYDDKGRQVEFRDDQTITLTENGVTKEATLSRWREGLSYYDADGDGHRKGMTRGYDETVFDSANPDKGQKTAVRNMRYDAAGRFLDGETASGEVSRLKDALRRIADIFSGSNLAQAGRNLVAGLERLVANTARLSAEVAAWLKENIADPTKGFVDSVARWLGAPGEAPPALSAADVEKLVRAVSEKAGGVAEADVPLGLVPAAKTLGVFDQGLAVTRTKAKNFDALGRAVSWVEETRSMAAPEKPVESEIRVTYEGDSARLASYAARVLDGEKVSQIFRDKYSYDALGRSIYREVRFEGEGLEELLDGAAPAAGGNPPTRALDWAGLSAEKRSALVDRLAADAVQVMGRVEIDLNEEFEYDAKGAVVSRQGERLVRGNVFTELGLEKVLPRSMAAQRLEAIDGIKEETAKLMEKQDRLIASALTVLDQTSADLQMAQEKLALLKSSREPLQDAFDKATAAEAAARAAKDAAQKAINSLLGTDLFVALAGEKLAPLPPTTRHDARGRTVSVAPGDKATVVDSRWYAVIRVRDDGRVVRTYVRRDTERTLVYRDDRNYRGWVEESKKSLAEVEDPAPPFYGGGIGGWNNNKGEKLLATIPTGDEIDIDSLDVALSTLRNHFDPNNLKKIFPLYRSIERSPTRADVREPIVGYNSAAQAGLLASVAKLSTLADTAKKFKQVSEDLAGAVKSLAVHDAKLADITEAEKGFEEAAKLAEDDLSKTTSDAEKEKARLAAEETRRLAEATAELDAQKAEWVKDLSGADVWLNGAATKIPAGFWETLLEKGEAALNGTTQTLAGMSAGSRVRTRLADSERFARLDENRPDGVSISWRGVILGSGSAATFDALRRAAQGALAADTDEARRAAFGLATDGRLTVSRVGAQTQDAAGRAVAQSIDTLEISRQGGETSVRRTTQSTQGFKYDARGQVIAYERTTHEAGKPDVVERLVGATYDAAGRLIKSDVRLRDPSSGYSGEIQIINENFSFGIDGSPRHSRRTQIKDGQVTVAEDLGHSRTDALGRVVFSLTNNLTTSLDRWNAAGGDFAAAPGDRSTTALWNRSFNARGEATASLRVTSKTGANGAWHTVFESSAMAYNPAGQVIGSTVKTVESGRDGAAVLFRAGTDRILEVKYDEQGRALRQRTSRTENGQTRETWDEADRKYDAFGRLIESHTKTRDALGDITESFWSGVYGAGARLTSYAQWNIANGQKTEERSVGAPVVDAQGRTTFPTTEVTEWNTDGTESITRSKTESGLVYNLFGQLVAQEISTKTRLSDGAFSTETKNYTYGYDTAGRQTKTWVDGREEAGGKVRRFNNYNEVLAFDAAGRVRRTLNRSTQGALITERVSLEDIRYDTSGRTVGSRERVHRSGVDPVTGAALDSYSTEIMETDKFDTWNRATHTTQTTLVGALKTVSAVQSTYGRDGRVIDQSTTYDEYSLAAGVDHRVHRVIEQTGMAYDGVGNLVDYKKVVKEGDLESTYTPVALEYDEFGRSVTALERVRDNAGRDEIVGALGTQFNGLGQVVGGQTVTIKGGSALLGDKGLLAKVTERLMAGDLANGQGTQLVADTGLEGIWSTRLLAAAYDAQGRQAYNDSVTDKAGHGYKDVVVDLVLAKGWVGKGTGWWYGQQFANALAKLKAEGAEIVYSKFFHGGGVHRRYCESLISYRKKEAAILESHDRTENAVTVFDPFGRALAQTVTAHRGDNTTITDQWLAYDGGGRLAMILSNVFEKGLNGDGTRFARTFSQSQEFTYDALGRSTSEKTITWADSQAPYKITTSTTDNISYDKGQRVGWTETTQSNDRTTVDERVTTGAGYDGLGRLATFNAAVYEVNNGVRKLQYKDFNVRNSYDALGRLALTLSDRVWGATESVRVATRKREKGLIVTGFATVQKALEEGAGGGGIAGLSEDWTTGRAAVAITYEYSNGGTSMSGMRVRAFGTGTHKEKTVQAAGIRLDHYQKNMRYDDVGRVTGYKLISTQVERYQYYKQGQSGLKRKVKSAWTTGAVTTVSDVEVLEYDGFGRQVHTVVTSERNDINKTWTRTETVVKSFDDQGRVKDVRRTTDSKLTLPKSSGGFLGGLGGLVVGALLAVTGVGLLVAIAVGAAVGLGGAAANWLGGQKMYSHNVVDQTMAYKADGRVDEEKTKAQTRTLEEKSYMMGQNFGDKMMQVSDIAVAVVSVVVSFVGSPILGAAIMTAWQAGRQGISINDFEAHADREQAHGSRMMAANFGATVLTAGLSDAFNMAKSGQVLLNVGTSLGVAAAGGADLKTMFQVGAIAAVNGLVAKAGAPGGSKGGSGFDVGALIVGGGELVRQLGLNFGPENQRTTWVIVGSAIQGTAGAGVIGVEGAAVSNAIKTFIMEEYAKSANGSGGTELERRLRGMVVQEMSGLVGTLVGRMSKGIQAVFDTERFGPVAIFDAFKAAVMTPFTMLSEIRANLGEFFDTLGQPFARKALVRLTSTPEAAALQAENAPRGGVVFAGTDLGLKNGALIVRGNSADHLIPRGDNLFEVRDATLQLDGKEYKVDRARLTLGDESRILGAVLVDSEGKTWIMTHEGALLGLDVLTQKIGQTKYYANRNATRLASLEARLTDIGELFSAKLDAAIDKQGSKSFFRGEPGSDKNFSGKTLLAELRASLEVQSGGFDIIDQLMSQGDFDLALATLRETWKGERRLERALATIETGVANLETHVEKFFVAFGSLNMIAGNLTPSGRVRVEDQEQRARAFGDMRKEARAIMRSGLVGPSVVKTLDGILVSGMGFVRLEVDFDLAAKQARGDFSSPVKAEPKYKLFDWFGSPGRMIFNKVLTISGLDKSHPKTARAASLLVSIASPLDVGGNIKGTANAVSKTKIIDRALLAAVEYGEALEDEVARDDATLYTKVAHAMNPMRFMKETYHTMDVNFNTPGSEWMGAGYFVSGLALNVLDVAMPPMLLAKLSGALIGHDIDLAAKSFGWQAGTTNRVKNIALGINTAMVLASGNFKYSPQTKEFLAKAVAFFLINEGVSYATGYYMDKFDLGGNDKAVAKQQMEFVVQSVLGLLGGKAIQYGKRYEATKMVNQERAAEMTAQAKDIRAERRALLKQEAIYKNELAKAELKLEADRVAAKTILEKAALDRIQVNNIPGGNSAERSIRANARAGGQLEQTGDKGLLLAKAKGVGSEILRAGEGEQGFGKALRDSEARVRDSEARVRDSEARVRDSEARVRAAGEKVSGTRAETQRLDRQLGRTNSLREGSERKAVASRIVESLFKTLGLSVGGGAEDPLSLKRDFKANESLTPQMFNRVKPALQRAGAFRSSERGAMLIESIPFKQAFRNFKESFFGKKPSGPPTVRANGDIIDIPMAEPVTRRNPPAPTLNAMVGNDMGFENGRPMSGNNPNLLRGPPNQFKDFLENQNQNNTVQLINQISPSSQTKSRFGLINSTLQNRQNALLGGSPGVNITPRSSALKYERIGSGNRTFLTDIQAVETIIGPLSKERIKITKTQARVLERELGLNRNYLESKNIIYIVNEINNRAPASPIRGNNYFQGAGKGLPGGGPELTINGIPSVGSQNIRQIILEVD
ncbi:MAG: hypothetical protein IPO76_04640 [Elusimicrobia bacterium]|nr:hypothetical protein [Elusimicrobiota bacterium]